MSSNGLPHAKIFNVREIGTLFCRFLGVAVAAASSLLAIRVFLSIGGDAGPYLIAMMAWLVFLPLLQFGFGRPMYSAIRGEYVQHGNVASIVRQAVALFGLLALLATLVFTVFVFALVSDKLGALQAADAVVLAVGLAANATSAFQRDYCYAVARDDLFEGMELVRRVGILVGFIGLWRQESMVAVGFAMFGLGLITQGITAALILWLNRPKLIARLVSKVYIWKDAVRFLFFSINELLLYNLPLVFFTLTGRSDALVFTAVWMKLFQVSVLPMRMLVDARVNRHTVDFHRGRFGELDRQIRLTSIIAFGSVVAPLMIIGLFIDIILQWLGAKEMMGEPWFLAGIAMWCIGNVVQHVYGSFILSYGGGFAFALKASAVALASSAITFLGATALGFTVAISFALMGFSYALSALIYRNFVKRLLRSGPDGRQSLAS